MTKLTTAQRDVLTVLANGGRLFVRGSTAFAAVDHLSQLRIIDNCTFHGLWIAGVIYRGLFQKNCQYYNITATGRDVLETTS